MALTAVKGIAENTNTPASSCHEALQIEQDLVLLMEILLTGFASNLLEEEKNDEEIEESWIRAITLSLQVCVDLSRPGE